MITIPLILLAYGAAALPAAGPITPTHTTLDAAVQTVVARDSADSLYVAARDALANGEYARAAKLFHDLPDRYPQSALIPDAMYYEAFARYRTGESGDLQTARTLLDALQRKYPSYRGRGDASALATRVCGALAQQGDAGCAAQISQEAQQSMTDARHDAMEAKHDAMEAQHSAMDARQHGATSAAQAASDCNAENDDRAAALNALLQMDADRAMPILEKVLARRDACSASLRRKAVMLVAQKQTPQTVDILTRVAQSDPDQGVRGQAVFWLSQVPGDRTVQVLSDILHNSSDPSIRDKAIFALSQNHSARAQELLRQYAMDASAPKDLRGKAIFWLGQDHENGGDAFLQSMYSKTTDPDLKDKILTAMMAGGRAKNAAWLLDVAKNQNESLSVRKKALFLASQGGASAAQIASLYDALPAGELREQAVFALSQMHDATAVDKLISIARSDKDPNARKRAIFWLGQSQDPRAAQFLSELIDK